jgi:exodeoxyribonuclease VIII
MKTIPEGVIFGMANEDYHGDKAIGSSGLKRLSISPLHYWAAHVDPARESVDKPAFAFGRAWHTAVFEPAEFDARYVVMPEGLDRRTKEGKALFAELTANGSEVLSSTDAAAVHKMARIALRHPISRVVFEQQKEHGAAEVSFFARDAASGAGVKIRPDYMLAPCDAFPHGLIIDGKTTNDAGEEGFARQVWNLGYGLQAALYVRTFQQVFGTAKRPSFLWLAQEKESPHAAAYYAAGEDLIAHFDAKIEPLLVTFAECSAANRWPGYAEKVGTLSMPAWAQKEMAA